MLNRNTYFIRERAGILKLSDTYDILEPETQTQIGIAKEKPTKWAHVLRLLVNKALLPTKVFVYEGSDPQDESKLLFSIERPVSFFKAKVKVCDKKGNKIGGFKAKAFSLGGAFQVFDASDVEIALVKGDWKGWNFKFTDTTGKELGTITKKWAGVGKELFTTADNYIIALNERPDPKKATLLLAAGLAVDIIYGERK